jgi:hypothetical protein
MGTVTIINTTPYKLQPVPEVGKEYKAFDDGKIRPSRLEVVKILEVIPFKECWDNELISNWTVEVTDCYWLYAEETDYFVKAMDSRDTEPQYFVRTKDGGWFSLGWFGSRLDIDGSLYEKMKEWYNVEE